MFESQNLCHEQGEVSVSGFTSNGKDPLSLRRSEHIAVHC